MSSVIFTKLFVRNPRAEVVHFLNRQIIRRNSVAPSVGRPAPRSIACLGRSDVSLAGLVDFFPLHQLPVFIPGLVFGGTTHAHIVLNMIQCFPDATESSMLSEQLAAAEQQKT